MFKCKKNNSFYLSCFCRTKNLFRVRKFTARFSLLTFILENFVLYKTFPPFLGIIRYYHLHRANWCEELTCFAKILEIFTFSLIFPGKKTLPTHFGYPERNVVAFSRFPLHYWFCRSILMRNFETIVGLFFLSRFPLCTLVLQKWTIFFVNISLNVFFWTFDRQKVLVKNSRLVQMRKQKQILPKFVL